MIKKDEIFVPSELYNEKILEKIAYVKRMNSVDIFVKEDGDRRNFVFQLPKSQILNLRQFQDSYSTEIVINSDTVINFLNSFDSKNDKYVNDNKLPEYDKILKIRDNIYVIRLKIKPHEISIFDKSGKSINFNTFAEMENYEIVPIIKCIGLFLNQKTYCTFSFLAMKVYPTSIQSSSIQLHGFQQKITANCFVEDDADSTDYSMVQSLDKSNT